VPTKNITTTKTSTIVNSIFLLFLIILLVWFYSLIQFQPANHATDADAAFRQRSLAAVGVLRARVQIEPSSNDDFLRSHKKGQQHTTITKEMGLCTATLINGKSPFPWKGYLVLTASHCISAGVPGSFSIEFEQGQRGPFPLTLIWQGSEDEGQDYALLFLATSEKRPTIPLGDIRKSHVGSRVVYAGWPAALSIQWFEGTISRMPGFSTSEFPLIYPEDHINWEHSMLVGIGGGPGASGSALIDLDQHAIIAVLSGRIGGTTNLVFCPLPPAI